MLARIQENARRAAAATAAPGRKGVHLAAELRDELHERLRRGPGEPAAVAFLRRAVLGGDEDLRTQRHVLATAPGASGTQQLGGYHGARPGAVARALGRRRAPCRLVRPEGLSADDGRRGMHPGRGPDRRGRRSAPDRGLRPVRRGSPGPSSPTMPRRPSTPTVGLPPATPLAPCLRRS